MKTREYIMRVRRGLKEDDILTSVFHEMVHIKQDLRKEHKLFDCTDIPILTDPWEQGSIRTTRDNASCL